MLKCSDTGMARVQGLMESAGRSCDSSHDCFLALNTLVPIIADLMERLASLEKTVQGIKRRNLPLKNLPSSAWKKKEVNHEKGDI